VSDSTHNSAAADGGSPGGAAPALSSTLERLRMLLFEEGGLMRSLLGDSAPQGIEQPPTHAGSSSSPSPAQLAASGPRIDGQGADYELLIETIYEGYLLHYHAPRVVRAPEADLGVLAGDRLYALGLARLVKLGDVEAVAELADVITLSALAHGDGRPELAEAVWIAGARAVGWGAGPAHDRAKALVRAGSPDALEAMRAVAAN
jgi:hypothetical protein